ncbi:Ligand of Numb protein X 2 [Schistosoma haematobium]|uniref:Ligand of Numb protein X 2 n=1 Tax=Schistosoma haematobium TaxID=6185 RepID=A0A922IRU9_SCHHA|nr:Ligand of Numb protein X 2 [Schistosoma haematobium]KAH9585437.1 Ligand of Numb protein X 2 [Schistosoma haematobium]
MQTGSCCDDSTGSVGGDSETNTTVASSPSLDLPVTKGSPLLPEPPEHIITTQLPTYDNLTSTSRKGICKMENTISSTLQNTATINSCEPSTPKFAKAACDASILNPFSNPPTFEPPSLPYSYSENITSGIPNYTLQFTPITSTPSSFPSPGSAFTELHPKIGPCSKSHFVQPSVISSMSPKLINREDIHPSYPTSTSAHNQNEMSSSNPKNLVVKKYLCRTCGQTHDSMSPHIYNYTQTVDADLCCTLCQKPLVDPLDTKCGHTFCSPCLKNHLAVQALCPVDKQIINYLQCQQASNIVKRLLDKLLVACPNSPTCDSIVYRSNLEEHLREWCVGVHSSSAIKSTSRTMQQHNQFKNVFLSTFIGTESHDSNMLQPIVSDSTRCLRIIDSQNFMKNNLLAQEQQNINYHNSNNESNFSFVYPNQYIKEFPNIYPSVTRIEMDKLNKTNYDSSLPCVEDLSDSPTVYEGVPVSILIYRPNDCMDLGFTFIGGIDTPLACILIQEIYLDGPVATDGRLRPGDQLLEANGNLLTHVTHAEAQSILTIPSSVVQFTVFREPVYLNAQHQSQPQYHQEIFYVKLCKRQGKVLGIKLVGKKHLPGLYVLELVAGCEADLDGRIKKMTVY